MSKAISLTLRHSEHSDAITSVPSWNSRTNPLLCWPTIPPSSCGTKLRLQLERANRPGGLSQEKTPLKCWKASHSAPFRRYCPRNYRLIGFQVCPMDMHRCGANWLRRRESACHIMDRCEAIISLWRTCHPGCGYVQESPGEARYYRC